MVVLSATLNGYTRLHCVFFFLYGRSRKPRLRSPTHQRPATFTAHVTLHCRRQRFINIKIKFSTPTALCLTYTFCPRNANALIILAGHTQRHIICTYPCTDLVILTIIRAIVRYKLLHLLRLNTAVSICAQ